MENAIPATKYALDPAKMLPLPRNLHMTLQKCCPCHEICMCRLARPCPWGLRCVRARSKKMPRLPPRNLYLTLRSCACHEICTRLAKMLRLPRNSIPATSVLPNPSSDRRRDRGSFQPAEESKIRRGLLFFISRFLFPTRARMFSRMHLSILYLIFAQATFN